MGRDGIAGLICLALSVGLLMLTRGLPHSPFVPVGPDFYPRIALVLMAVLSAMLIGADFLAQRRARREAAGVAEPAASPGGKAPNYALVTATFAVFAGYVVLLPLLGFRVATFVFVVVLQAVLERPRGTRRWLAISVAALATVAVTYLAFETYLSVLLPRGRWTGF